MDRENNLLKENLQINALLTLWDDDLGCELIDIYPIPEVGDPEKLAIQFFTFYQLFYDNTDVPYQKTYFTIPLNNLNRKAKILFDVISDQNVRGGFRPFIIALLVPDYYKDKELNVFNEILLKISQDYIECLLNNAAFSLKKFYSEIVQIYDKKLLFHEEKPRVDEYYSYTIAMEDFQAGVNLFKSKNFEGAYKILSKVLLKFEKEEHRHLMMEVIYLIASIFIQQRQFKLAKSKFKQLRVLANQLDHEKYYQVSLFMEGFCAYKNENFMSAKKKLEKIDILKAEYINNLQYYVIYANIMEYFEKYEDAIDHLEQALVKSKNMGDSEFNYKQKAQIYYELGINSTKLAINNIQGLGIHSKKKHEFLLKKAINYFKETIKIVKILDDYNKLISLYQLIGDLYGSLGNYDNFFIYYQEALKFTSNSNNDGKRINLINKISQKQIQLKLYEDNVNLLEQFFTDEQNLKFIDKFTISNLYYQFSRSLLNVGKTQEALSKLIKSYEILSTFKRPVSEIIEVIEDLIKIFEELNNRDKISYFSQKLVSAKRNIEKFQLKSIKSIRPLEPVKEIWIYSSSTGVGLYNYSPETNIDHDLLGGFLTALQQFSLQISRKKLESLIIGDDLYLIYQKEGYDFYILGRADVKYPFNVIKNIISKIHRRFWKEYSDEIQNFKGKVSIFKSFDKIIKSFDLTLELE
jgi:hypothetical protein